MLLEGIGNIYLSERRADGGNLDSALLKLGFYPFKLFFGKIKNVLAVHTAELDMGHTVFQKSLELKVEI